MEEWKDVPGFEGLYQVSSLGAVRSLNYMQRKGVIRTLQPGVNNIGYRQVRLKSRLYCVHRLVAAAFLCNPNNLPEVDHLDRNKANNTVANLQYKTLSANRINVPARSKSGEKNIASKSNGGFEVKFQRDKCDVYRKCFPTLAEAITARDAFLQSQSSPPA